MNEDLFRATVRKYMELRHIRTISRLAEHTTVSGATMYRYFNDPESIPIGVFLQIMKALNVPNEEKEALIK